MTSIPADEHGTPKTRVFRGFNSFFKVPTPVHRVESSGWPWTQNENCVFFIRKVEKSKRKKQLEKSSLFSPMSIRGWSRFESQTPLPPLRAAPRASPALALLGQSALAWRARCQASRPTWVRNRGLTLLRRYHVCVSQVCWSSVHPDVAKTKSQLRICLQDRTRQRQFSLSL